MIFSPYFFILSTFFIIFIIGNQDELKKEYDMGKKLSYTWI